MTNARGNVIESYSYDAGDRLTDRTDAHGLSTGFAYDVAGRLQDMTDRRGLVTSYEYDEQGRVISNSRPEGVTRFTYDAVGRLTEISEPAGSIAYTYDAVDRLVREVQITESLRTEIVYAYDAFDRRISRTVNGVAGETTTYGYDRANRLTSIGYRGETTTFEYDAAGRLRVKTLPNGIRQELTYDDAAPADEQSCMPTRTGASSTRSRTPTTPTAAESARRPSGTRFLILRSLPSTTAPIE